MCKTVIIPQNSHPQLNVSSNLTPFAKTNPHPSSTIIIFIMSMQLDILVLAPDTIKDRPIDTQPMPKQELFNDLMTRLKERNSANELFIKRYIRKYNKRHTRLEFSMTLRQKLKEGCDPWLCENAIEKQVVHLNHHKKIEISSQEDPKEACHFNDLKETNHTLTQPSSQEQRVSSIPTLNIREKVRSQPEKIQENHSRSELMPNKDDRQFTKYLRNFFLHKIVQKSRLKEREEEGTFKSKKSYQGRANTQIEANLKYKLKVKSLVFGNSEVLCPREVIFDKKDHLCVNTEPNHVQRYDHLKTQESKNNKAVLPTINNSIASRNKRCLQNYIRSHHEKAKEKSGDFRTVKLPTQCDLPFSYNPTNRKGIYSKLNTISVGK